MKTARKIEAKVMVATLCLAAGTWLTAQAQNAPVTSTSANKDQQKAETTTSPGQPTRMNKCSQLIGTEVENQQGDKLGKIDDVVVDLDTGRVSYCVLNVEHGLFATPKYLAVPLSAMHQNEDGSRLILNAVKNKVAQAQGFDRNNWPSVTNPVWGAQPFWQTAPKGTISAPEYNKNAPSETRQPSDTSH